MENNALLVVKILLNFKPVNPSCVPLALQDKMRILTVWTFCSTCTHNIYRYECSYNKFVFLQFQAWFIALQWKYTLKAWSASEMAAIFVEQNNGITSIQISLKLASWTLSAITQHPMLISSLKFCQKTRLCTLHYHGNTTENFDPQVSCQCSGISVVLVPGAAKNSLKKRTNSLCPFAAILCYSVFMWHLLR